MPPEVTNRAVSFGPPEVVKIQPCRPNDYEHDAGPLSGLVAIGPVMTFAAIAVLGLMWVVRVFCQWVGIALLACVLLSSAVAGEPQSHQIVLVIPRDKVETQIVESPFDLSDVDASIEVWSTFEYVTKFEQTTPTQTISSSITSYHYTGVGTYESQSNLYFVHPYDEGEDTAWTATFQPIRVVYTIPAGKNQAGKRYTWRLNRDIRLSDTEVSLRFTSKSDWVRRGPF